MVRSYLLLTEFKYIVQKEMLHVQCTTHNAVIPSYRFTDVILY